MKKSLLTTIALLFILIASAQPKAKEKEKAPTQKEMEDMMKDAQKELDNMSAEDKKMMDSMGIKMPYMKKPQQSVSGISDAQLKKAYDDETRIVPQKDAEGLLHTGSYVNNADVNTYLSKTQQSVVNKLPIKDKTKSHGHLPANNIFKDICCQYGGGLLDQWSAHSCALPDGRSL